MKKNKTVAFMLAASLMVGGTFLGTKAWFTDEAAASNDLVVTMGTLDINTNQATAEWNVVNNNSKVDSQAIKSDSTINTFTNASTGDIFSKVITIKNDGSLTQNVTVSELVKRAESEIEENVIVPDNMEVSLIVANKNGEFLTTDGGDRNFTLSKDEERKIKIEVTFNTRDDGENAYGKVDSYNQSKDNQVKFDIAKIYKPITVTAEQVANKVVSANN